MKIVSLNINSFGGDVDTFEGMKKELANAKELLQEQIFTGYMGKLKKLNMTFMGKIIKLLKKNAYI